MPSRGREFDQRVEGALAKECREKWKGGHEYYRGTNGINQS